MSKLDLLFGRNHNKNQHQRPEPMIQRDHPTPSFNASEQQSSSFTTRLFGKKNDTKRHRFDPTPYPDYEPLQRQSPYLRAPQHTTDRAHPPHPSASAYHTEQAPQSEIPLNNDFDFHYDPKKRTPVHQSPSPSDVDMYEEETLHNDDVYQDVYTKPMSPSFKSTSPTSMAAYTRSHMHDTVNHHPSPQSQYGQNHPHFPTHPQHEYTPHHQTQAAPLHPHSSYPARGHQPQNPYGYEQPPFPSPHQDHPSYPQQDVYTEEDPYYPYDQHPHYAPSYGHPHQPMHPSHAAYGHGASGHHQQTYPSHDYPPQGYHNNHHQPYPPSHPHNAPYGSDFTALPKNERFKSTFRYVVAITGLIITTSIIWGIYKWISEPASDAPVLIAAKKEPFKSRPETPGGTNFPYQDKLVYDRLLPQSENQPEVVERLLPDPESVDIQPPEASDQKTLPMTPSSMGQSYERFPAQSSQGNYPSPAMQESPSHPVQPSTIGSNQNPPSIPSSQNPATESSLIKAQQSQPTPVHPAESQTDSAAQALSTPTMAQQSYVLQLGTLPTEAKVKIEKKRLQGKTKKLLKTDLSIKSTMLSNKTIVYRLVTTQKFPSKEKAAAACKKLGGACKPVLE